MDLRAGELRKHGLKIRFQEQPFRLLAMLVEHAGEVVTREELRKELWPADTFVDFDHGLNKAINKIRRALGDSAESPRFVETVARRGYRFLAEVRAVEEPNRSVESKRETYPPAGVITESSSVGKNITGQRPRTALPLEIFALFFT